ncbi:MAG: flagellin, partial [Acetatifactor sp.]|nr:flagellin [Acetatifactor sp.]
YNYNTSSHLEQLSSRSRLEDLDMPQAISEKKKEELLRDYRNLMLRNQMDEKSNVLRLFH